MWVRDSCGKEVQGCEDKLKPQVVCPMNVAWYRMTKARPLGIHRLILLHNLNLNQREMTTRS